MSTHKIPDFTIPAGLSTKLGLVVSAGLGVVAAATAIINGDVNEATIMTFAGSVVVLYRTLGGRFDQAAALLRDVPPPPIVMLGAGTAVKAGDPVTQFPAAAPGDTPIPSE